MTSAIKLSSRFPRICTNISQKISRAVLWRQQLRSAGEITISGEDDRNLIKPKEETNEEKKEGEEKKDEDTSHPLFQFFDKKTNWGVLTISCGREWTEPELRGKSNEELHKLWYVLLKERNMLMTMKHACDKDTEYFPNPERLDRVELSMENLEAVVRERNRAHLELETGETGERPTKKVTLFTGFVVDKPLDEHILPPHMNPKKKKEYELPYLEDDAYLFQKYWKEKQFLKKRDEEDDYRRINKKQRHIYQSLHDLQN